MFLKILQLNVPIHTQTRRFKFNWREDGKKKLVKKVRASVCLLKLVIIIGKAQSLNENKRKRKKKVLHRCKTPRKTCKKENKQESY